jgi:hypothetical protein
MALIARSSAVPGGRYPAPAMRGFLLGYLDPGTGSVLLQAIVGGAAAVAVAARLYWRRITRVFRRDAEDEGSPT